MKKRLTILLCALSGVSLADEPPAKGGFDGPAGKPHIYKTPAGKGRRMEIYFPPNHDPAKAKVPGLILFHGGGWSGGTLAQFRAAGYDTFYCGKHGNTSHPADCSFDKSVFLNAPLMRANPQQLFDDEVTAKQLADRRAYAPHVVSWLAEPARKEKPFFVFDAPSIPHDPLYPEPEDLALYTGDKRPPLPVNAARDHAAVAGFNLRDRTR